MEKNDLDLIIAVVNDGFSSEVLKYANEIAEVSATIIKGRGTTQREDSEGKQGVYCEKESVFIVTEKENKNKIMENISNYLGLASNAQGIIFSVPLDDFAGFNKECKENFEENAPLIADEENKEDANVVDEK